MTALVQAARRSLAEDLRVSCVRRLAVRASKRGIRHAATVEVGRLDVLFVGKRLDLRRRAVDEDDADVERAQHRDVQQDIGEVLVCDDRAVNADDEGPLPELRNVLQDAPQIGWFHLRSF